jgi:putative cell wall-binding protein
MKKKIIGILVCMLVIAITVPTVGSANRTERQKFLLLDGVAHALSAETIEGGV